MKTSAARCSLLNAFTRRKIVPKRYMVLSIVVGDRKIPGKTINIQDIDL